MKKQKLTGTQIVAALKQYEGGREALDVCREYGVSKATLYNWRKKYNGIDSTHIRELKTLQDENRRLKQMYSELMLDHQLAKYIIVKSCNALSQKRADIMTKRLYFLHNS